MKRVIFGCLIVVSFLTVSSARLMAQGGNIHFGKLKIIPGIAVDEVYDDNIYLGNGSRTPGEREESDWITHFKPSLFLDYSFGERGGLNLGYMGDLAYYSDNDDNNWDTHNGIFNLNYNSPGGIILGIDNFYTDAEDPYGSQNQYGLGVPKTKRWSNDLKTKAGFKFSEQFKVLGYYNFFIQDYKEKGDYAQDYDDNEFGAGFFVKVLPKTWGFIRYHYGERDFSSHPAFIDGVATNSTEQNDADFDWHRVNAGLTWDTGAKLSGEINFGYQWQAFDNRTDSFGMKFEDKDTWIAKTAVTYDATPTTQLTLSLLRGVQFSGSNIKEYYEDTGIGLQLKQKFMTKFTLNVSGDYNDQDYNLPIVKKRDDDNYNASIGLDYQIQKWLSAGIGYSYMKKDSNYKTNEYTDNQFTMSVSLVY